MEGRNDFYIKLEKQWFYNDKGQTLLHEHGDMALMIYTIMLRNLTSRNSLNFSVNELCDTLLKTSKSNNSILVNKVKAAIRKLDNKLFKVYTDSNCNIKADLKQINNNITYYALRMNEPLKTKYIMAYDSEIDKLIKYSCNKKNSVSELITHFIFICNGIKGILKKTESVRKSKKDMEGVMCYYGSMEVIEERTGIKKSTLLTNNIIFLELNLLFIGNPGGNIVKGKYTNTTNVYARIENKVEFDAYMDIRKAKIGIKFKEKEDMEQQNKQRRLKQLINRYKQDYGIDPDMTKDDLTIEQFQELNKLETDYVKHVIGKGGKVKNCGLLTVNHEGETKLQYIEASEDVIEVTPSDGWGTIETKR
jgi:hypothetical protein